MKLYFKFDPFLTNIEGYSTHHWGGGGHSAQHWGDSVPLRRLEWTLEFGVGIDTWCLSQDREFGPGIRHPFGSGFQLIK